MIKHKNPYITVGYAQSLDGRLATVTGDSQWIGGPESLQFAHELRRDHEAILVGIGTVLKDDPRLTCRIPHGRNPIRIILDSHLQIPLKSNIVTTIGEAPVWILHGSSIQANYRQNLESAGCVCLEVSSETSLNVEGILDVLRKRKIKSVFVEGGARVITSFLASGVVDRLLVVTAPLVIGKGLEAVGDLGIKDLKNALRSPLWRRWPLGCDEVTELRFSDLKAPGQVSEEILGGS